MVWVDRQFIDILNGHHSARGCDHEVIIDDDSISIRRWTLRSPGTPKKFKVSDFQAVECVDPSGMLMRGQLRLTHAGGRIDIKFNSWAGIQFSIMATMIRDAT